MCLDGIERQCAEENIPYEILIVDNGSFDGTIETIEKKARQSFH